jgi:hypothetical protein
MTCKYKLWPEKLEISERNEFIRDNLKLIFFKNLRNLDFNVILRRNLSSKHEIQVSHHIFCGDNSISNLKKYYSELGVKRNLISRLQLHLYTYLKEKCNKTTSNL